MGETTRVLGRRFLRGRLLRAVAVGGFLILTLGLIMILQFLPSQINLQVGEVSPVDIHSPRRITYISNVLTEEAKERARDSIAPVYDPADPEVLRQQVERAQEVFGYIDSVRRDTYASPQEKEALLTQIPQVLISPEAASLSLQASDEEWQGVVQESLLLLDQILRQDIQTEGLAEAKRQVPSRVSVSLSPEQAALVEAWVVNFIVPNSFPNPQLTEQAQTAAAEEAAPVGVSVEQGEVVLREGDVTTPLAWEKLGVLGLRQTKIEWPEIGSRLLFTLVMVTLLVTYLYRLHPNFWEESRKIFILVLLLVTSVLGAKILVIGGELQSLLFPTAAVSMLLATLVDPQISIASTVTLSMFLGYIAGGSWQLTLYALAGGSIAALRVYRLERINNFLWAGVWTSLASLGSLMIFNLLTPMGVSDFLPFLVAGLANAGLSASLALGGFFLLSNLLGIVTPLQLLELARPTHPLLKELLLKAPGTYHHSLMVSSLAEQAAEAVGADPLLTRVGAYYHDVGKTLRPYLFIENQEEGMNIHDRMEPKMSAQMIIAHVQDGLDLAKKHGLPPAVRDFIPQHHGTTKTAYFYQKVLGVDAQEFTYPGPRPKSREAGIVMLADGVEATIRAEHPSAVEETRAIVDRTVESRLREGQLDGTDLTLRDLEKIKETFLQVLEGFYHPRLRYPEESGQAANRTPGTETLSGASTTGSGSA